MHRLHTAEDSKEEGMLDNICSFIQHVYNKQLTWKRDRVGIVEAVEAVQGRSLTLELIL